MIHKGIFWEQEHFYQQQRQARSEAQSQCHCDGDQTCGAYIEIYAPNICVIKLKT